MNLNSHAESVCLLVDRTTKDQQKNPGNERFGLLSLKYGGELEVRQLLSLSRLVSSHALCEDPELDLRRHRSPAAAKWRSRIQRFPTARGGAGQVEGIHPVKAILQSEACC